MIRNKHLALLVLAASTLVAPALAVPQFYDVAGGSVTANSNTDIGLEIQHSLVAGLPSQAFILDDGESFTFDFFHIWTPEGTVNWEDDLAPHPIVATLNFTVPSEGATVSGTTFGGRFIVQAGILTWEGPATVVAGDRTFEVSLSNEIFNLGVGGLGDVGATVKATVRQISSTAATVPDSGSTVALLSVGLLGLAALRRTFVRR